jgi:hypothetical protein
MDAATRVMIAQLTSTLVAPGVVTLAVALLPLRLWRRDGDRPQVAALALAAGLLAGLLAILGVPEGYPPTDTIDWLILLPIPAAAGMGLLGAERRRAVLGSLAAWMVLGAMMTLWPLWSQESPPIALTLAALALGALGLAGPVAALSRAPSPALFAAMSLWALGAAAALGLSGSALLAQLLGMVAAANGLMAILSRLIPALAFGPGALGAAAVLVWSMILYGYNYLEMSPWAAATLALAPLGALAATRGAGQLRPLLASLGAVGLLVALPVGLAAQFSGVPAPDGTTAPGDEDSNYGYGDEHQQGEGAAEEEPYAPY